MDSGIQGGYVYILTNESLPGLVKIGMTKLDPFHRAAQLRSTGMPTEFVVAAAVLVDNPKQMELYLHRAFADVRFRKDREFFKIDYKSVLKVLLENLVDASESNKLIDLDSYFGWDLNIKILLLLKRDLNENVDLRLKIAKGENYLDNLWLLSIEGDEKSQNEIIRLEKAGSVRVHNLIFDALLAEKIKTDVFRLLTLIVNLTPHQIPEIIKNYPQHTEGFGKVYMNITDVSDDTSPKKSQISSFKDPSLLVILLYSWDVILAGGLNAEDFARQLGGHLDLSQHISDEINSILLEAWQTKSFIGQDLLMQDRLITMKRLLTILAVLP